MGPVKLILKQFFFFQLVIPVFNRISWVSK